MGFYFSDNIIKNKENILFFRGGVLLNFFRGFSDFGGNPGQIITRTIIVRIGLNILKIRR
jgi:hypothetical protein